MKELLAAALTYSRRGWRVFPVHGIHKGRCTCGREDCSSPGKHPLTRRGLHDATTNTAVIAGWWRQWRRANVAIATGKASAIVVVDLDLGPRTNAALGSSVEKKQEQGQKQPDALGSLDALVEGPCSLPATLTAVTGGGGVHLYYAWERELSNAAGKLPGCGRDLPGVDLRADGGYVLAPPSTHVSGGRYEWLDPQRQISPAPEWLRQDRAAPATIGALARVRFSGDGSAYGLAVLNGELARLRSAGKGRRNHELNRAAFAVARVVAGGELLEAAARAALRAEALRIGLTDHESELTIKSAFRAGIARPRNAPHRSRG